MKTCFNCNSTENDIPLIELTYQEKKIFICPGCVPKLIHNPGTLVGTLPGAENLKPADEV
ncbi:MAG: hypothetical protein GY755_12435 [Chloroflexi bacterium]|nr:hypothetical protein [Chloroflexota bacterium]